LVTANSVSSDFRHGVITAISCWLATMVAFWLRCDNPWWAAISAWVTSTPDLHASAFKGLMRIVGTFAGYAVGRLCALELAGNPLGQATAIYLIGSVGTYMRFRTRFSYGWTIGSVTAFILVGTAVTNPDAIYQTGHYRLYEIIAGVISSMACRQFLSPLFGLRIPPKSAARRSRNQIELELVVELELDFFTAEGG
jgi:uncharacterized membrane protein YccC